MAGANEKKKEKNGVSNWWDGVKTEWGKIVWADRQLVTSQTSATIVISVIISLLIVLFDMVIQFGVDKLVNLTF